MKNLMSFFKTLGKSPTGQRMSNRVLRKGLISSIDFFKRIGGMPGEVRPSLGGPGVP